MFWYVGYEVLFIYFKVAWCSAKMIALNKIDDALPGQLLAIKRLKNINHCVNLVAIVCMYVVACLNKAEVSTKYYILSVWAVVQSFLCILGSYFTIYISNILIEALTKSIKNINKKLNGNVSSAHNGHGAASTQDRSNDNLEKSKINFSYLLKHSKFFMKYGIGYTIGPIVTIAFLLLLWRGILYSFMGYILYVNGICGTILLTILIYKMKIPTA
jgi:hypothetical protein